MKKKLKVEKAFFGKMMKAATAQGKKVIKPGFLGLPPRPPGTVPGSGAGIVLPGQINPFGPGGLPIGGYGSQQPGIMQQPIPRDPGYGSGPIGFPKGPINVSPFNSTPGGVRGPTQAAPVQPVPAMKKGGAVRGVRIALRGAKKATIY